MASKLAHHIQEEVHMKASYESVLITGGLGYIGSQLAESLASKYSNLKITVFDLDSDCPAVEHLKKFPNIKILNGDVRSIDFVRLVIERRKCDAVIHLAAVTACTANASLEFTKVNTIGTHILLELCQHLQIKKFILVSTDAVYGTTKPPARPTTPLGEKETTSENAILHPSSPYAAAHAAAEMMTRAYHTSYDLDCNIVRLSNVYGPKQAPSKLISNFILCLLRQSTILIHGDGLSKRNYIYIDDVVSALDVVLHCGAPGKVYSVASSDSLSVLNILEDICSVLGMSMEDVHPKYVSDRPFNDVRRCVSDDKMNALGWSQNVQWNEGLHRTISWFKECAHQYWQEDHLVQLLRFHVEQNTH